MGKDQSNDECDGDYRIGYPLGWGVFEPDGRNYLAAHGIHVNGRTFWLRLDRKVASGEWVPICVDR